MILSVDAGMGLSRNVLALALLAAGTSFAMAAKLEKAVCKDLNGELASVLATGVRDDMARGPEWAKANLTPDRLGTIKRLIEIEEQLQFRCGVGRGRAVAKSASETNAPSANTRSANSSSTNAPSANAPSTNAPSGNAPSASASTTSSSSTTAPPASKTPAEKPDQKAEPATPRKSPSLATDTLKATAVPAAQPTPPPAVERTAASAQAAAARKKPARREGSNAYVSPTEVNPYFVGGGNSP